MSVNRFFGFVIFLVASVGPVQAQDYTLDQMAAGMNVLRAELDGNPVCGIDAKVINRLPQLLQARVDLTPKDSALLHLENCETRCRCGFYLDWLKVKNPEHPAIEKLSAKNLNLKSTQVKACADFNVWFCKSSLLRDLKQEATF